MKAVCVEMLTCKLGTGPGALFSQQNSYLLSLFIN